MNDLWKGHTAGWAAQTGLRAGENCGGTWDDIQKEYVGQNWDAMRKCSSEYAERKKAGVLEFANYGEFVFCMNSC